MAETQIIDERQFPLIQPREKTTENGYSTSQILAVVTLLPIGGFLLFLAGITLTGTLISLAISIPLFIIFSPILIPAVIVVALSMMGFLTSGAFGVTALSSLSWMANYLRRIQPARHMEQAKRWVQEAAGQMGQKIEGTGQYVEDKAQKEEEESQVGQKDGEMGQNVQIKAREYEAAQEGVAQEDAGAKEAQVESGKPKKGKKT